ncbi:hypothetical protein [Chryseobacterium sp. MP_3.2]|uniref:hypothetical protein n=1 Tax=Chryseobacterium sp. MP_3.2 TaxID=3071712 RepID=UPI002E00C50C|nr:hypothetical protein [Chryseobacterium sp. MP_3.2]
MKNYVEIKSIEFNDINKRIESRNYPESGLYFSKFAVDNEVTLFDLAMVNRDNNTVVFLCPADVFKTEFKFEKIDKVEIETLVEKNNSLLDENDILRQSYFTAEKKLKIKDDILPSVLHSENSGISEGFVLSLVKLLIGNKI